MDRRGAPGLPMPYHGPSVEGIMRSSHGVVWLAIFMIALTATGTAQPPGTGSPKSL